MNTFESLPRKIQEIKNDNERITAIGEHLKREDLKKKKKKRSTATRRVGAFGAAALLAGSIAGKIEGDSDAGTDAVQKFNQSEGNIPEFVLKKSSVPENLPTVSLKKSEDVYAKHLESKSWTGSFSDINGLMRGRALEYPEAIRGIMDMLGTDDIRDLLDVDKLPSYARAGDNNERFQVYEYASLDGNTIEVSFSKDEDGNVTRKLTIYEQNSNGLMSEVGNVHHSLENGEEVFDINREKDGIGADTCMRFYENGDMQYQNVYEIPMSDEDRENGIIPAYHYVGDNSRLYTPERHIGEEEGFYTEEVVDVYEGTLKPVEGGPIRDDNSYDFGDSDYNVAYDIQGNGEEGFYGDIRYRAMQPSEFEGESDRQVVMNFSNVSIVPTYEGEYPIYEIHTDSGSGRIQCITNDCYYIERDLNVPPMEILNNILGKELRPQKVFKEE